MEIINVLVNFQKGLHFGLHFDEKLAYNRTTLNFTTLKCLYLFILQQATLDFTILG